MTRFWLVAGLLVLAPGAWALSPAAREFMQISKELEPVHCEKRKLRREIALAQVQQQDVQVLKRRFAALDRDPKTAKLEKRLAELQPRVEKSSDPEDLAAISAQHREAFYRCE
jgi:hypothetical protein